MLVLGPQIFAQTPAGQNPGNADSANRRWYSSAIGPYQSRYYPQVNVSNSDRINALLRAGNLYLSLSDAIALSLENSLDMEVLRYDFPIAQAAFRRHAGRRRFPHRLHQPRA